MLLIICFLPLRNLALRSLILPSTALRSTILRSTVLYSTIFRSTALRSTVLSAVLRIVFLRSTVLRFPAPMAFFGCVLNGLAVGRTSCAAWPIQWMLRQENRTEAGVAVCLASKLAGRYVYPNTIGASYVVKVGGK